MLTTSRQPRSFRADALYASLTLLASSSCQTTKDVHCTHEMCRKSFGLEFYCASDGYCDVEELHSDCEFVLADEDASTIDSDYLLLGYLIDGSNPTQLEARKEASLEVLRVANQASTPYKFGIVSCSYEHEGKDEPQNVKKALRSIGEYFDRIGVQLVVGPSSTYASSVLLDSSLDPRQQLRFVMISPSATAESLQQVDGARGRFWRTVPSDAKQGERSATMIGEALRDGVVLQLIILEDQYANQLAEEIREALSSRLDMPDVVDAENTSDVEAALRRLRAEDGVLIISRKQTSFTNVLQRVVELDAKVGHIFLTDGAANSRAIEPVVGTAFAERVYGTRPGVDDREQHPVRGDDIYEAFTLDATWLALYALAWAHHHGQPGVTIADIKAALPQLSQTGDTCEQASFRVRTDWPEATACLERQSSIDLMGYTGNLDFDAHGDMVGGGFEVWRIGADGGVVAEK